MAQTRWFGPQLPERGTCYRPLPLPPSSAPPGRADSHGESVGSAARVSVAAAPSTSIPDSESASRDEERGVGSAKRVATSAASFATSPPPHDSDKEGGVGSAERVATSAASLTAPPPTVRWHIIYVGIGMYEVYPETNRTPFIFRISGTISRIFLA
jgi:hypothetical protein